MKAISVEEFGGPKVLSLVEVESPDLKANEVLVNVEAAGVGTVDVLSRRGVFPGLDKAGFILGMEIAGTVCAVGANISEKWKGRRVYALSRFGGYAEQVAIPESSLVPIPDNLSNTQAVCVGINALVAHYSLERASLSTGDKVLVRGAGGGIGSMTAQLAIAAKYELSVMDTKVQKRKELENFGVRDFISLAQVSAGNKKFNALVDPVGGSDIGKYIALLAENGTYVLNGAAGGFPPIDFGMNLLSRFQNSLTFVCLSLDSISSTDIRSTLSKLFQFAIDGKITPIVAKVFPLKDAAMAHQLLETGSAFGKIVLKV